MNPQKKILVIDDDETMRELMSEIFSEAGYETTTASSGAEALNLMRNAPVWVLFIDLKMAEMDGAELCRKVHEEWPMSIAYAVTGYSSLFELNDCRDAGFEDYFTKPVDRKLVLGAAAHAFDKLKRWTKK